MPWKEIGVVESRIRRKLAFGGDSFHDRVAGPMPAAAANPFRRRRQAKPEGRQKKRAGSLARGYEAS